MFHVEPFVPRRGLRSADAQTIVSWLLPRDNRLPVPEDRLFAVEPEIQVLCRCHWQPERRDALTVIAVHGLEGSTESQYIVGTANKAWAAGMNVVRMNMRNCGGTHKLAPTLYHSGLSGDVGAVMRALIQQDELPRIALVGFSMGGNLVLKLAGELGRDGATPPQLIAAAGISPAVDLSPSSDALNQRRNRLYEWNFVLHLRRNIRRKAEAFPGRYDPSRLKGVWSVRGFDDAIVAPYCGFADAEDYYTRSSASNVVEHIAVPTLVLNAVDDPFIRIRDTTRRKLLANPHVRFVETEHGGHCGFLAAANGYDGRWAERQVVNFFREAATGIESRARR